MALAGTIAGGAAATGGTPGDAMVFGNVAATLVIEASAVFGGNIVANYSVNDRLVLAAGEGPGTLSGLGTSVNGFDGIDVQAYARWTLAGSPTGPEPLFLGTDATLEVKGAMAIGTLFFATGGGTLKLDTPAQTSTEFANFGAGSRIVLEGIKASGFSFANDALTLLDAHDNSLATLSPAEPKCCLPAVHPPPFRYGRISPHIDRK